MKYKTNALAAYNGFCSTRLASTQLLDYIRRLDKLIESTNDEIFKEDLVNLRNAVYTLKEGLKKNG